MKTPQQIHDEGKEALAAYIEIIRDGQVDIRDAYEDSDESYFRALQRHEAATRAALTGTQAVLQIAMALGVAKGEQ
jgi:hypothetical protein